MKERLSLTPYAVLLVRPLDNDDVIRHAYHAQAEQHHPDKNGGVASEAWFTVTEAYNAIKTEAKRREWRERLRLVSGQCRVCVGNGVIGSRVGGSKIRSCVNCKGRGRL